MNSTTDTPAPPALDQLRNMDAAAAVKALADLPDATVAELLHSIGPARAVTLLERFPRERREAITLAAGTAVGTQWREDGQWPAASVGRLMEHVPAIFVATTTVAEVIAQLRPVVSHTLITYIFVIDQSRRLQGVVAFRELTFASPEQTLGAIMIAQPFALKPDTPVIDAMRDVVRRHYPVYPVCDDEGRLLGLVRGAALFEEQAFEISAQAGSMVGVEKEERTTTAWPRALKFRHPWLQINLFTAFIAAAVVGYFQNTINEIVLLAVFLPVLAGQCGNTGCQALAVTLRGMTLGELRADRTTGLIAKEALLGFVNGSLTGIVAGAGMFVMASIQHQAHAPILALITFLAMAGSCAVSGIAGATIPLTLKRLGADPATASSIFLTTATDVVSMGVFLSLAAWLIAG
ncbi:MAG: magnesium transporter [Dokdonella sp.]